MIEKLNPFLPNVLSLYLCALVSYKLNEDYDEEINKNRC